MQPYRYFVKSVVRIGLYADFVPFVRISTRLGCDYSHAYSTFPRIETVKNNVRLNVDLVQEKHIGPIFDMIQKVVGSSEDVVGFDKEEFETEARLRWFIDNSYFSAVASDVESGEAVCLVLCYPSPLCRSVSPSMNGGYIIIPPKYQNLNVGKKMMGIMYEKSQEHGYEAMVARSMMTNTKSNVMSIKAGCKIVGWIPSSFYSQKHGWTDDILVYADYKPQGEHKLETTLSRIKENALIRPSKYFEKPLTGVEHYCKMPEGLVIRSVNTDEQVIVFDILQKASEMGDTFALDEFPTYEVFVDKFLHGRTVFIAEKHDTITGVAIVGPSPLCRAHSPRTSVVYIYILPEHRKNGIGKIMLENIVELTKKHGYTGILSDLYTTPDLPYGFLKKTGFTWVGLIPNSGFVKDQGLTDCGLFYKDF